MEGGQTHDRARVEGPKEERDGEVARRLAEGERKGACVLHAGAGALQEEEEEGSAMAFGRGSSW